MTPHLAAPASPVPNTAMPSDLIGRAGRGAFVIWPGGVRTRANGSCWRRRPGHRAAGVSAPRLGRSAKGRAGRQRAGRGSGRGRHVRGVRSGPPGCRQGLVAVHCSHIHRTEAVTVVDDVEVKGTGQLLGVVLRPPGPQLPTAGSVVASAVGRRPDPGRRVNRRVSRTDESAARPARSVRSGGPPP